MDRPNIWYQQLTHPYNRYHTNIIVIKIHPTENIDKKFQYYCQAINVTMAVSLN